MKIKLMASLAFATLVGCSATGNDYIKGEVPTIVKHPTLGDLTVAERELLGPDANQNGIRDDIDVIIDGLSGERKSATTLYAQGITKDMILGSRGVMKKSNEETSTTVTTAPLTKSEEDFFIAKITSTPARKAAFFTWRGDSK